MFELLKKWQTYMVLAILAVLFWTMPSNGQPVGQPVPLATIACSKPQYVKEMQEALLTAPDEQSIRVFLEGFNAGGKKCLPLRGILRYNGLYETFIRSDGALIEVTEFLAHDGRRFYTFRVTEAGLKL